jgi:type I restriction enzyme S subunit
MADALRRKRKRSFDLLDGLAQSIFFEMFGDPIENPAQFPVTSLESVVSHSRKITYGILKPGPDQVDGVPYVRVVDIQRGDVNVARLKRTTTAIASEYKRSALRSGDLLISIRGHVGRMAIAPAACDGANITQDTARLAIASASTEFVKAVLETGSAKHWMAQRTKGAAVQGINLGDLKVFPLFMPPRRLQDEFAHKVMATKRTQHGNAAQRASLDAMFFSLQHRAFTGQL